METLKRLRHGEHIQLYTRQLTDKKDVPYLLTEIKNRTQGTILVVTNHAPDIPEMVLSEICGQDSGYVFFQSELQVDPISNRMVPVHRIPTDDELSELARRRITKVQLPVLKMKDPVRRWHNFPLESIVAIDRDDSSSKTYWRRVL